ncbi:Wzz/FepE/Etk N-terminal domain-containing protein [Desulfurobacterium indicum]|uniref:Polysaccharide chain length determinant N-terminal domain-containing protein n=1 Tax=Desulfurobacterium indicum TaxID=1914305 RepID=A0A1R1MLG4_9BACT|nr:Wzz/FepE/Etk N-terminal domain-containing protein [Desulfurobacterium indicum]OMH40662.1 hypothetical protein BLW93_04010 [Desulfurobacterium indicum]
MPKKFKLTDLFRCVIKHKFIFLLFTFLGIITGILISFFYTPTYQITAILSTPHTVNKVLIPYSLTNSLIEELNREAQEKQFKQLSARLKIKKNYIKGIKHIGLENLSKNSKPRFIKLVILTKYQKDTATIIKAFVNYLANQKFIKDKLQKERNIALKNLLILKKQVPKLTLIANKTKEKLLNSKDFFIGFNPADPDISLVEIKKEIESLEYMLKNIDNFKLINTYTEISPLSASKKTIIIICAFIGSLSGILIIFLKYCQ